jgi:hypothetical protein
MADKLYMIFEGSTAKGVPKPLPKNYGNISGFNLLSDDRLKMYGWMPLVIVEEPSYDPDDQYRSLEYVVGESDITPTYTITDFLDVGRVGNWCSVVDGAITGGPFKCPKVWDGVQMYLLTEEEINAMGWYKCVDVKPEYDVNTQYLSQVNEVALPVINTIYTVNDYTIEQIAEMIEQAQTPMLTDINVDVNTYINSYYDPGTQQTFTAIYTQQDTPTAIKDYLDPVLVWISSIMAYYYGKKQSVIDAETLATIKGITWDFTTFDATKPDVSLQALMVLLST